ncbi:hypothetical protein Tsubulata_030530 [Turnera subulata]|uniref:Uncharacterized protein n=1 Tax=Turnera subulata TaxID=218843 RepID=A0A9Q0G159_9ROSI|nr:hypothetical protein Tsubulata_030530 [Turnera subulata]
MDLDEPAHRSPASASTVCSFQALSFLNIVKVDQFLLNIKFNELTFSEKEGKVCKLFLQHVVSLLLCL